MADWVEPLLRLLPEGRVQAWDEERLADYATDASDLGSYPPQAVVFAESTEEVQAVLRFASERRIPVTPCAARTGKSGGSLPVDGGIALSLERMNRILELSPGDLTLRVEAGCITGDVMKAAEEVGLFYPPDPNSWETCSIGGNVAENASGPRALKYGSTRDYVLGLVAVLADGTRIETGKRTIKGVAGYDLTSLLVGSEGTLAVVTEVTLRLIPKPPAVSTALCVFGDTLAAARAVQRILEEGILPRTLELFDDVAIQAVEKAGSFRFPEGAGAAVLLETDGEDEATTFASLERAAGLALEAGALDVLVAQREGQREELWATRRMASTALRLLRPMKISEDVVVPRSAIPRAIEGLKRLGERHGLLVATYGHAGDGNLHFNVLYERKEERARVDACIADGIRLVLDLGGTITGEHGVGLAKKEFLPWEQGEAVLSLQRQLKRVFDPQGVLNPKKIF